MSDFFQSIYDAIIGAGNALTNFLEAALQEILYYLNELGEFLYDILIKFLNFVAGLLITFILWLWEDIIYPGIITPIFEKLGWHEEINTFFGGWDIQGVLDLPLLGQLANWNLLFSTFQLGCSFIIALVMMKYVLKILPVVD